MAPGPPLKWAYCKEKGHTTTRCTHLAEDFDKRIVRTQGESYLFPNYQGVPMEGNESAKNIVRAFSKEQAELNKKFMEKTVFKQKPEEEVNPTGRKSEDKSISIAHDEDWSNWKPPTISSANDPFESHIGLKQTKKRMKRQAKIKSQRRKQLFQELILKRKKMKKDSYYLQNSKIQIFQNQTNLRR
ncbi:hypothetical protein O181_080632 [Austropuccinia psidii MF-1]|uniref:Uncharacterized protein n=1 Tax=Austropuccinia psidii MF-1 TaxID=1389203 RepID=A0A9Q3FP87_9BASI|nr:hypothetical protein [Austropuccinia psidii MF-1]